MRDLLDRETRSTLDRQGRAALRTAGDQRRARAELRRQIGRLERQLASLAAEAFPRFKIDTGVSATSREPRALGLGELEQVRDALANRVEDARRALRERADLESRNRALLERMLASPADFKWVRISRDDLGEPACGHWHSRPRLGLIGMLMGWWRVRISSGCPLPGRLAAVEHDAKGRRGSSRWRSARSEATRPRSPSASRWRGLAASRLRFASTSRGIARTRRCLPVRFSSSPSPSSSISQT
jgi:hypothetical protein